MRIFFITILTVIVLITTVQAQVPQGISYQAIAFGSGGAPIVNGTVGVRVTILDNSISGNVVFCESHTKTTNAQGLFNLIIGQGSPIISTLSAIDWSTNSKYLRVEIDPNGGTNYVSVGVNQLLSVPYAMFAEKSSGISDNSTINNDLVDNKYANFAFYSSSNSTTYAFNQKTGFWVGQGGGGSGIIGSNGNFAFYSSSNSTTYAFNQQTGTWIGQSGGGSGIIGSNGNFAFYSSSNSTTYAFNQKTGTWVGQSGGGSGIIASNGNFAFYSSSNSTTYAFNQKTGTWVGQSGGSSSSIIGANGNFAFYSSSNSTTYAFNKSTGTWVGQGGGSSTIVVSESN